MLFNSYRNSIFSESPNIHTEYSITKWVNLCFHNSIAYCMFYIFSRVGGKDLIGFEIAEYFQCFVTISW